MLGDETARIGLVAADRIAEVVQGRLDDVGDAGNAARSVAVAEHDIGPWAFVAAAGERRHRVAIDQDGGAEVAVHPRHQAAQGPVIGLVEALDAAQRVVHRNTLMVDFLGIADHARDRAEPARHPHRARIGERRQPPVEHAWIELVGLAVDVHIAAREMRAHEREAPPHHAGEQLVDEGVLGAPQLREVEPGGGQEGRRIDAAAMGRVENDRPLPFGGFQDFERRLKLVAIVAHACFGSLGADVLAAIRTRPYPIYNLLSVALSMACRAVPRIFAGSRHLYLRCGLWNSGQKGAHGAAAPASLERIGRTAA